MKQFNWDNYPTDKLQHGYESIYDKHLLANASSIRQVLEIGSRYGSALLWLDYFPQANVTCVDLVKLDVANPRFTFKQLNLLHDISYWEMVNHLKMVDVVIDDGPHTAPEQLKALDYLLPIVSRGGIYVIEDLHCTDGVFPKEYKEFMKDSDISINELCREWKQGKFKKYKYIDGTKFQNFKLEISIERGTKIRWPGAQKDPSEIIFIKVL